MDGRPRTLDPDSERALTQARAAPLFRQRQADSHTRAREPIAPRPVSIFRGAGMLLHADEVTAA